MVLNAFFRVTYILGFFTGTTGTERTSICVCYGYGFQYAKIATGTTGTTGTENV